MAILKENNNKIVNEVKNQRQKVIDKLKGIDSALKLEDIPEKKEYKSDAEFLRKKEFFLGDLKDKAENNLASFKNQSNFDIQQEYDRNKIANKNELNKILKESEIKKEKIYDIVNQNKEDIKENAVNNGMARSSIYTTKLNDLEKNQDSALKELKFDTENKVNELRRKSLEIENQRDMALSNFEIEYAVKLQKELDDLVGDITNYNNKIVEYNNKLKNLEEKKKADFEKNYQDEVNRTEKRNKEILRFLDKYGYGSLQSQINKQKVDIINEYLNSMDKNTALKTLMEDDSFLNLVGESTFKKIIESVKERKF